MDGTAAIILDMFGCIWIYAGAVSLILVLQVAQQYGRRYAIWAWILSLLVSAVVAGFQFARFSSAAKLVNQWDLGGYSWLGVVCLGTLSTSYLRGLRFELPDTRTGHFVIFLVSLGGLMVSLFGIARIVIGDQF